MSVANQEGQSPRDSGLIGSLLNGLTVFDMFSEDCPVVTVGEIAKRLDTHKSTASRIAATLVQAGYLRPAQGGHGFQLGGKLLRLGALSAGSTRLKDVAEPYMRDLVADIGETCHVGILDGTDAVTVALVDGSFSIRMHSWVGKRTPAHVTSLGKVLLSGLTDADLRRLYLKTPFEAPRRAKIRSLSTLLSEMAVVRQQHYALDNEELEVGLRCVASPIYDSSSRLVAGLAISGSSARISDATLPSYISEIGAAADRISAALGYMPPVAASRSAAKRPAKARG